MIFVLSDDTEMVVKANNFRASFVDIALLTDGEFVVAGLGDIVA
jgi:hypothetical protein